MRDILATCIVGGPFLKEGANTLTMIGGIHSHILHFALKPQRGLEITIKRTVHQFFDQAIRTRWTLRQALSQGDNKFLETHRRAHIY